MAKDAKGHGSDAKGGDASTRTQSGRQMLGRKPTASEQGQLSQMTKAFSAFAGAVNSGASPGEAHVHAVAAAHGVPTDHLDRSYAGVMARNPGYGNLRAKSDALASERSMAGGKSVVPRDVAANFAKGGKYGAPSKGFASGKREISSLKKQGK